MQGHIQKRSKDSWTVVVDMGRDPIRGKRRQVWRSVKGTKRDAQALLVQLLHQRDVGTEQLPGKVTVAEFFRRWLKEYAASNVAPATLLQYQWAANRHIIPALGGLALTKLRPTHIQSLYTEKLQRGRADGRGGLSAKSVLHIHRLLREVLAHAVRWQVLSWNADDAVAPPRAERCEPPMLSPEAARRLLAVAEDGSYGALVHVAVMTGMRRGEILGLRWEDVDLDGSVLHVRQAAQWLPGKGWTFRQPKTAKSRRPIALAQPTVQVLRQHRLVQLEERLALGEAYADRDLVFATSVGAPIGNTGLRRVWKRIAKASGHLTLTFHDLRHLHASLLLLEGANPKVVSERLGHSSVSMTLDVYSHIMPNLQTEAAEGLGRLLAVGTES